LLHKIIQTRAKKVSMSQGLSTGQSDAQSSVLSGSENLVMSALEKSIAGLASCNEEVSIGESSALRSGDKSKISSLAGTVASIQGRYLVSRGLLKNKLFCL
jgi:hypothetical protein